jgi:AcrR family transcriptional regulator
MTAAGRMLETQRFADLSVASILSASGAAKGSFYFYFADKDDLLAALVREAVGTALDAAQAWTGADPAQDPVEALRAGTLAGARLWQAHAPVLRAVVEAAGTDSALDTLWRSQMDRFTELAMRRLEGDLQAAAWLNGRDPLPIVTALTWLGERVHYLAATNTPPFTNEAVVVEVLTDAWALALYGRRAAPGGPTSK